MNKDLLATITAIMAILILTAIALFQGINGAIFSVVIATIAGLAGFRLSKLKKHQ